MKAIIDDYEVEYLSIDGPRWERILWLEHPLPERLLRRRCVVVIERWKTVYVYHISMLQVWDEKPDQYGYRLRPLRDTDPLSRAFRASTKNHTIQEIAQIEAVKLSLSDTRKPKYARRNNVLTSMGIPRMPRSTP